MSTQPEKLDSAKGESLPAPYPVCIETVYALCAALRAAEVKPAAFALALNLPVPAVYNPEGFPFDGLPERWKLRALIYIANIWENAPESAPESAAKLRALIAGKRAEVALCDWFNVPIEEEEARTKAWIRAEEDLTRWFGQSPNDRLYGKPDAEPKNEPHGWKLAGLLNPIARNALALIQEEITEGDLLELYLNGPDKCPKSRVEVREAMQAAIRQGEALASQTGGLPANQDKRVKGGVPCACAVCFYRFGIGRSMAMECGNNFGFAVCSACNSPLDIRAVDFEGALDSSGADMKSFRRGFAPESAEPTFTTGRV